jgi:CheY-like chemotaxis protein
MPKISKLLLVEDNPDQAEIYATELTNSGFEVFHTADGEEALQLAKKEQPDLILLDLMLGNSSGLDILKAIKANPATKGIKVVAVTNFREKELLENQRIAGIYDYIYKPDFTPRELARKIREYLV